MGKAARSNGIKAAPTPSRSVNWPALAPPFAPLELQTLIEDQVLVIPSFLSAKACAPWTSFFDSLSFERAAKPKRGEAARTNERFSVQDETFAATFWQQTGLRDALLRHETFKDAKGLNGNIRLYRYNPGQAFAPHYDDSVVDSLGRRTRWTLLLYITGVEGGLEGGETIFHLDDGKRKGESVKSMPCRGQLLLHRHGDACMLHEGAPVTSGVKLLFRTDVSF